MLTINKCFETDARHFVVIITFRRMHVLFTDAFRSSAISFYPTIIRVLLPSIPLDKRTVVS